MMTTKLKSFLVLLAMMVGAVNGAWADNTSEYYSINYPTSTGSINFSAYWVGDAQTYSGKSLTTTFANGTWQNIPNAFQLTDNQWISFSTTKTSTIYIGVYIDGGGTKKFKFDNIDRNINVNTAGAYEIIEIECFGSGNHSINKSSDEVGIYYIRVVEHDKTEFNNVYPYIWDFTTWTTTEGNLNTNASNNDIYWNNNIYQKSLYYSSYLSYYDSNTNIVTQLPETKGLKFHTDGSTANRLSVSPNECLKMYVTNIIVPSVPKGYAVKIVTAKTRDVGISVGGSSLTLKSDGVNQVYTYNSTSDGDVTLSLAGNSSDPMKIYSITVDKGDVPQFEVNGNDLVLYDNPNYYSAVNKPAVNSLAIEYNPDCPYIRFKLNMGPTGDSDENWTESIAGSAFTITNSSNTNVISIDNPVITSASAGKNRVYIYGAKVNGCGTTELTFRFAGNNIYKDKIIKATVTVYDNTHPYLAFNKATDSYNLTALDYTEPTLTVLPTSLESSVTYSSNKPTIAIPSNDSDSRGNLMVVNTGVVTITASIETGGNTYTASYNLTIVADEANWDVKNGNECYFPGSDSPATDNTGKLLVRRVTLK